MSDTKPLLRILCETCNSVESHGLQAKRGFLYPRRPCLKCRRETRTPLEATRGIWNSMKARCHSPTCREFRWYGVRGIEVCQEWRESFDAFLADMGERPFPDASIERIDNNKGYSPDNCRWIPRREQSLNQRSNLLLTWRGETKHLAEWSRETGISSRALSWRLRNGWSIERALTTPPQKRGKGA